MAPLYLLAILLTFSQPSLLLVPSPILKMRRFFKQNRHAAIGEQGTQSGCQCGDTYYYPAPAVNGMHNWKPLLLSTVPICLKRATSAIRHPMVRVVVIVLNAKATSGKHLAKTLAPVTKPKKKWCKAGSKVRPLQKHHE